MWRSFNSRRRKFRSQAVAATQIQAAQQVASTQAQATTALAEVQIQAAARERELVGRIHELQSQLAIASATNQNGTDGNKLAVMEEKVDYLHKRFLSLESDVQMAFQQMGERLAQLEGWFDDGQPTPQEEEELVVARSSPTRANPFVPRASEQPCVPTIDPLVSIAGIQTLA